MSQEGSGSDLEAVRRQLSVLGHRIPDHIILKYLYSSDKAGDDSSTFPSSSQYDDSGSDQGSAESLHHSTLSREGCTGQENKRCWGVQQRRYGTQSWSSTEKNGTGCSGLESTFGVQIDYNRTPAAAYQSNGYEARACRDRKDRLPEPQRISKALGWRSATDGHAQISGCGEAGQACKYRQQSEEKGSKTHSWPSPAEPPQDSPRRCSDITSRQALLPFVTQSFLIPAIKAPAGPRRIDRVEAFLATRRQWESDPWLQSLEAATGRHRRFGFHKIFADLHEEQAQRTAQFKKDHRRPPTKPYEPATSKRRDALRWEVRAQMQIREF